MLEILATKSLRVAVFIYEKFVGLFEKENVPVVKHQERDFWGGLNYIV
jgi:hypothetical protein